MTQGSRVVVLNCFMLKAPFKKFQLLAFHRKKKPTVIFLLQRTQSPQQVRMCLILFEISAFILWSTCRYLHTEQCYYCLVPWLKITALKNPKKEDECDGGGGDRDQPHRNLLFYLQFPLLNILPLFHGRNTSFIGGVLIAHVPSLSTYKSYLSFKQMT